MSSGSGNSGTTPVSTSNTGALRNAVEESQRGYDKKVEVLEEIDDKAMRSVRTAVILSGLVASAVGVSGPSALSSFTILPILIGCLGVVSLAISIVYGIGIYTVTRYTTGIGPTHRSDVITGGYTQEEWLVEMLYEYDDWSSRIEDEIDNNKFYLDIVQLSLLFSVISLITSASMIVLKVAYGVSPVVPLAIILIITSLIPQFINTGNTKLGT